MKKEPSPPSLQAPLYDSYRPKGKKKLSHGPPEIPSPFSISGLKFNNPLKNQRTQKILLSDTRYLSANDDEVAIVIKNVTVAFRIMLFYESLWGDDRVWEYAAQDIQWPTSPDGGDIKRIIMCHSSARRAYLEEERSGSARPFEMTSHLRVCLKVIDRFCDTFYVTSSRGRASTDIINRKRDDWCRIMKHNPTSLLAADFIPESPKKRPGREQEPESTLGSSKSLPSKTPGVQNGASSAKSQTDNGNHQSAASKGRKRPASPGPVSPQPTKGPRLEPSSGCNHVKQASVASASTDLNGLAKTDRPLVSRAPSGAAPVNSPPILQAKAPSRSSSTTTTSPPLNLQGLPPATRQLFKERIMAMRMYGQLLKDEISKLGAIDHTETPDLVVSEIVEMQSVCDTLQQRDIKITEILDGQLLK